MQCLFSEGVRDLQVLLCWCGCALGMRPFPSRVAGADPAAMGASLQCVICGARYLIQYQFGAVSLSDRQDLHG